jgi:hypothetical protein
MCKVLMNIYGEHATNCYYGSVSRHNKVCDTLDTLASLCLQSCLYVRLNYLPDTARNPAGRGMFLL